MARCLNSLKKSTIVRVCALWVRTRLRIARDVGGARVGLQHADSGWFVDCNESDVVSIGQRPWQDGPNPSESRTYEHSLFHWVF